MDQNKGKRILTKSGLLSVAMVIAISGIAQSLMNLQFRQSDKKILRHFSDAPYSPHIYFKETKESLIRVVDVFRHDSLSTLVFVHGAPGSSNDFIKYLADEDLQLKFNMITYDRPGYGYSDFGNAMTSIEKQASIIHDLTQNVKGEIFLIGHSFGGPIALRFAMDFPERYSGVIMLAPANDPDNEIIFKIAYLGKYLPTRWLTPTAMKVAADEKFSHATELRKMLPLYPTVNKKVIHVHGDKDSLVPFANLPFTEKKLENADFEKIVLKDEDHFIPWTQFDLIKSILLGLK